MPQPLSSFDRSLKRRALIYTSSTATIRERPKHALLAMTVVAKASSQDAYLSSMLITFLGSNAKPTFAMFDAIHQTAKSAALKAAAKSVLSAEDHDVFSVILAATKAADKHRNRLAHWIWAYSEDIEDGILLIDPPDNFDFLVRIGDILDTPPPHPYVDLDKSKILVYSESDLITAIDEYEEVSEWTLSFNIHVHPTLKKDDIRFRMMQLEPRFQTAIARVKAANLKRSLK